MAVTHGLATRNAIAQAVADQVSSNGKVIIKAGSTVLVTLTGLAFGAPANGVLTANTLTAQSAAAAGVADSFEVQTNAGVKVYGGVATLTGSGGDMTMDNTNIAQGQQVRVSSLTYTAPV